MRLRLECHVWYEAWTSARLSHPKRGNEFRFLCSVPAERRPSALAGVDALPRKLTGRRWFGSSPRATVVVSRNRRYADRQGGYRLRSLIFTPGHDELFKLLVTERLLAPEDVGDQSDLGKVLHRFHLHVGMRQVGAVRNYTVIGHENGVELRNKWLQRLGEF